jgi:hypothetical protein
MKKSSKIPPGQTSTEKIKSPYVQAMMDILELTLEYKKHFLDHPKNLAWFMWKFSEIHYASRHDKREEFQDHENPKYTLGDFFEAKKANLKYVDYVYDAWCASIHTDDNFIRGDKLLPEEGKLNKTMDEWITLKLNPAYRFHSIYPDKKRVLDHMLCTIGNGYGWNKSGFICEDGPNGTDLGIFFGYDGKDIVRNLPQRLKEAAMKFLNNNDICIGVSLMQEVLEQERIEREGMEKVFKFKESKFGGIFNSKPEYYPMSDKYSLMCTMPNNAHSSYVEAGLKISHEILGNPKESDINRKIAKNFISKWSEYA